MAYRSVYLPTRLAACTLPFIHCAELEPYTGQGRPIAKASELFICFGVAFDRHEGKGDLFFSVGCIQNLAHSGWFQKAVLSSFNEKENI